MTNTLALLQQDFKLFLQALWGQLDLPSPTRAQYAIADYIQYGPKRLQIQAFRGVGKSWITGAFVLWTLFNDAHWRSLDNICSHPLEAKDIEDLAEDLGCDDYAYQLREDRKEKLNDS